MRSSVSSSSAPSAPTVGPSRRTFLTSASLALASVPFTTRSIAALPQTLSHKLPLRPAVSAAHFLPESVPDDALRALASAAIDAARGAGATYADVRMSDTPAMGVNVNSSASNPPSFWANGRFAFGLRVIVDGACTFTYGDYPDLDLITTAARNAVAAARGLGRRQTLPTALAPAPVVQGTWEAPMQIDPFTVPLQAQWDVVGGYIEMVNRVKYAGVRDISVGWDRETRVFASTDGTMLTQRFHQATFTFHIGTLYWSGFSLPLGGPLRAAGGFELATDPMLHAHIVRRAEEVVRLASVPTGGVEVGRHTVVATGTMMGRLIGQSLNPALELDRAIGWEAGASGTSYFAPPLDVLGTQALSPLLTVVSERDAKAREHARWDDDGVECTPVTLIDRGRVVDFLASRATAPALRSWYERQNRPFRSNGSAIAHSAHLNPLPHPGHVTLQPSTNGPTLDDLCRGVTRGYLVYDGGLHMDQQLASLFCPAFAVFELVNGRIARRVRGAGFQAATKRLWTRSLKALGGVSTMEHEREVLFKSQPRQYFASTVSAPAALFSDVDVVRVS